MLPTTLTVGVIQMNTQQDKEKNIAHALAGCEEALQKGAQFLALPETFNSRACSNKWDQAETLAGPTVQLFQDFAKNTHSWILLGSISERLSQGKKISNTSVLISDEGHCHAVYRKMHLFDADVHGKIIRESDCFVAGETPVLTDIKGIKTGLSICYDLRFGYLYERYRSLGAHMLCIPSSFTTPTGKAHWEVLLRARAIENQCFVIAPNQVGMGTGGVPTFGNSLIIDPWGTVLAKGSEYDEEVLVATLNFQDLVSLRKSFPLFEHKKQL